MLRLIAVTDGSMRQMFSKGGYMPDPGGLPTAQSCCPPASGAGDVGLRVPHVVGGHLQGEAVD